MRHLPMKSATRPANGAADGTRLTWVERGQAGLLATFLIISTAGSALACESGHWVESVASNGAVVVLEDGSVWSIDYADQIDVSLWLPLTDITACSNMLINTEDGEIAHARRLR